MKFRDRFYNWLSNAGDYDLYLMARRYIIQENLGFRHNEWRRKSLEKECRARSGSILSHAEEDAIMSISHIEAIMFGTKVIDIKRIDHMSDTEITELLQSIGAAKDHPVFDWDKLNRTELLEIFGYKKENLFLCKVSGHSMKDAGISDGDLVTADRTVVPADGDVVVVSVNDGIFIKRLKYSNSQLWLLSENDEFESMHITEDIKYSILGVVKHIIHTLK